MTGHRAAVSDDPDLAALVSRFALPEPAGTQLTVLLDRLVADPHAPTAIRDPRRALEDHIADSLVALALPEIRTAGSIVDLGAGAGVPGLPLAIARPDAAVTLVDAVARKCAFIADVAEAAGLRNVTVVHARAEELTPPAGGYDVVVVRALASLAVVAEYAAPLLRLGGTLVAWRGRREAEAEADAEAAAEVLGLQVKDVVRVEPCSGATDRHLHLMSKVRDTPPRFPRRAGMAVKRPLGR